MSRAFEYDGFKERRREFALLCRTTLIYHAGGLHLTLYKPFGPLTPEAFEESLLTIWSELRASTVPQKEALYVLLTLHPWCWEKWGIVATDILQGYDPQGNWYCDVIQDAQTVLGQELRDDDKLWEAALERSVEAFPGWITNVFTNRCRDAQDRLISQSYGTKKLHRKNMADGELEQVAGRMDVVAAVMANELRSKVDNSTDLTGEWLKAHVMGQTIREIAAAWAVSKDKVARAISERLRKDFKSFL